MAYIQFINPARRYVSDWAQEPRIDVGIDRIDIGTRRGPTVPVIAEADIEKVRENLVPGWRISKSGHLYPGISTSSPKRWLGEWSPAASAEIMEAARKMDPGMSTHRSRTFDRPQVNLSLNFEEDKDVAYKFAGDKEFVLAQLGFHGGGEYQRPNNLQDPVHLGATTRGHSFFNTNVLLAPSGSEYERLDGLKVTEAWRELSLFGDAQGRVILHHAFPRLAGPASPFKSPRRTQFLKAASVQMPKTTNQAITELASTAVRTTGGRALNFTSVKTTNANPFPAELKATIETQGDHSTDWLALGVKPDLSGLARIAPMTQDLYWPHKRFFDTYPDGDINDWHYGLVTPLVYVHKADGIFRFVFSFTMLLRGHGVNVNTASDGRQAAPYAPVNFLIGTSVTDKEVNNWSSTWRGVSLEVQDAIDGEAGMSMALKHAFNSIKGKLTKNGIIDWIGTTPLITVNDIPNLATGITVSRLISEIGERADSFHQITKPARRHRFNFGDRRLHDWTVQNVMIDLSLVAGPNEISFPEARFSVKPVARIKRSLDL